jgi:hypothetical protein
MGSLSLPTPAEPQHAKQTRKSLADSGACLLVAGFDDPVAADYVAFAERQGDANVKLATGVMNDVRAASVVVFLTPSMSERDYRSLDDLLAGQSQSEFIGVVSTFRVHLGDQAAAVAEAHVLARTKGLPARTVFFRPGHVLSRHSRASVVLRRLGFLYPLVPRPFRGCCIEGEELFAAIERERRKPGPSRPRAYALLGPNLPWRDWLAKHRSPGIGQVCLTAIGSLLALLLVGQLAGLMLTLLTRLRPSLRRWNFDTLRPRSIRELLELYNSYNSRHVKVVGYNNGVVHFGQRHPGKTIISTVGCNRVANVGPDLLAADCGATVRKAMDFLAGTGRELPVVPNYSYVCLGTAFFVPIHGSAASFSTIADTIVRAVLYDPAFNQLIAATRDEPAFRDHLYDMSADVLLLRLYLQVAPKSRYYVHRQTIQGVQSKEILAALRDEQAANVELRKSSAAGDEVTISKYYRDPGQATGETLEIPRDALGRLWDRLEENPVTSFLMHALTRHLAWHVELFFTAEEFARFWETHRALPLRKIQIRHIRRDNMPHSPFRDHDCVSVDLFMLRRHRQRFEAYLKETFTTVRANPGKHSR